MQEKNDPQQHGDPGTQGTRTSPPLGEGQHKPTKHSQHDEATDAQDNDRPVDNRDANEKRSGE